MIAPTLYESLPEPFARQVDRICDHFEAELRDGYCPQLDSFLQSCPESARAALLFELLQLDGHYRNKPDAGVTIGLPDGPSAGSGTAIDQRYVWLRDIGAGGMGQVSLCLDQKMGRAVAVKELRPELANNPEAAARFRQEARVTARLSHPGIVPVHELAASEVGDRIFYTMRHVEGETLTSAVRAYHGKRASGQDAQLNLVRLLNAFVTVCQAVAYAHSQGVLHRDLKGGNVILGGFGEVIVLDWGLAKVLDNESETSASCGEAGSVPHAIRSLLGTITGTPGYMAPEQAIGRSDLIGSHTDVYGLGAILYEILTGRPPFIGPTISDVLEKAAAGNPVPPEELVPDVPADLSTACLRALAKEPSDRHPSASALAEAVQRWLADMAERSRAREERERFFGLSLDLLCTLGTDGRFQQVNPAWEKSLGWTVAALQEQSFFDLIHPNDGDSARTALEAVAAGSELPPFVNRCRRAEGGWRWVSWSMTLIHGEHLVYAVGRDVTEQKEAEAALKRSQERFELAVRGSGVGLWDWDRETGESYYSPRWKSMIGYEDHEISHDFAEWESRIHPEDRERALAAIRACTEDGETQYEVQYRFRRKDGSYLWILDRGVAVCDDTGRVIRMAGSHTDISDRRPPGKAT